jgi:hypothetical protein
MRSDLPGFRYYEPQPKRRDYTKPPSPNQLTTDLNTAHDNIKKLVKEKDALRHQYRLQKIWIRILTAAVIAQWAVMLALGNLVLKQFLK